MGSKADVGVVEPHPGGRLALPWALRTQKYHQRCFCYCNCSERIVRCCRESIYRLLPQTTPENVSKNFSQYSIDPVTRYPNVNVNFLRPSQVRVPGQLGMSWPLSDPVRPCGYKHTQPSL